MTYKSHPVAHLSNHLWCFYVPHSRISEYVDAHGPPVDLSSSSSDHELERLLEDHAFFRIGGPDESRRSKLVGPGVKSLIRKGELKSPYQDLLEKMTRSTAGLENDLERCLDDMKKRGKDDPWGAQLDWTMTGKYRTQRDSLIAHFPGPMSSIGQDGSDVIPATAKKAKTRSKPKTPHGTWPKWYWDLTVAPTNDRVPFGELDLTTKKSVAPLLLRLQWQGFPLIHSRNYKWLYRIPKSLHTAEKAKKNDSRGPPVSFDPTKKGDELFVNDKSHVYFRLPHKDGEGHNVGNPLSKSFVKAIESGELRSAAAEDGDEAAAKAAHDATNMNVLCSYWMSSRERIMDQMVVYRDGDRSKGMILPQVITMGTVTRRAVEATWLTASNAKKNRVGSELKAMVRAPPGYAIVGADVDSEELWIASVMGDSQFGMHGATAIGWMTLEGTKSAGTDLHSKTASILGISRDSAKVFNYSRIYGAGQKHAVQLLLQGDSTLTKKAATERAKKLYAATKGDRMFRNRSISPAATSSLWHGGSESFLFNTLEAIALSDRPMTPALGCGVTRALRKSYLEDPSSYLPSRINWVVQSSGVDYLHLLIVSMEYLIKKYDIKARYLLSVHDEVRYLAEEGDRYRTALALQVANAWTRALFSYNLGIDDLPQGVAFFSAVDVDHLLRKEVFMTCETPSHPRPIPQGESLDIEELLVKTNGGQFGPIINSDSDPSESISNGNEDKPPVALFSDITSNTHQLFLKAQAASTPTPAKRWLDGQPPLKLDIPWIPPAPKASRRKKAPVAVRDEYLPVMEDGEDVAYNVNWDEVLDSQKKAATG
jgi:DNA polymerase gamma 1